MGVRRLPDWPSRLDLFLRENKARRFEYGEWDCCQMAAQAIAAMTGQMLDSYEGSYCTWTAALRLAHAKTGEARLRTIVSHVMKRYGFSERPPNFAQRGDLMLVWGDRRHVVGVLDLGGMIAVLGEGGMARIPRSRAVSSWAI